MSEICVQPSEVRFKKVGLLPWSISGIHNSALERILLRVSQNRPEMVAELGLPPSITSVAALPREPVAEKTGLAHPREEKNTKGILKRETSAVHFNFIVHFPNLTAMPSALNLKESHIHY